MSEWDHNKELTEKTMKPTAFHVGLELLLVSRADNQEEDPRRGGGGKWNMLEPLHLLTPQKRAKKI